MVFSLGLIMAIPALGVEIVGHRGASADAPENTVASYKLAWAQGADAIEGDYWLTADKKVICIHDGTTDRTTGVKGKVTAMTLAQLRALDAGAWKGERFKGEKLPLLEEVLATVPPKGKLLLELKSGPDIVPEMKRIVDASGLKPSQVVVISFNEKAIVAAKQAALGGKWLWLYDFKKKDGKWTATQDEIVARTKALGVDGLDVGYREECGEIVNAELARKLKANGLEFHAWTVDSAELARKLVDAGVMSITTNRPGELRKELSRR
jgi:glycerophosphoryl diester phosphodiesterase